jgi:carbonic anhydrase
VNSSRPDRRSVLRLGGLLALSSAAITGCGGETKTKAGSTPRAPVPGPTPSTADEALVRLKAGNARFIGGSPAHPDQTRARRTDVATAQHPFAQVIACVDSRVAPELVFDEGLGNLFVSRSAGQTLDHAVLGSIEFGVAELNIPLLLVLGHERCGAVKATLEAVEKRAPAGGNDIDALVDAIRPAVDAAEGEHAPDALAAAIRYNVTNVVDRLSAAPVLQPALAASALKIVGAVYDLDTGQVDFSV